MGIIARQGSLNAIYIVGGTMIGAVSNILIFPLFFKDDLRFLGFLQLYIATAALFAPFLTLGSVGVAVRYFPKLKAENRAQQLNFYCWIFPIIGITLFGLFLIFLGKLFIDSFIETNLVSDFTFLINLFLITVMMTYGRSLSGIAIAKTRTDFIVFLNEILIRLLLLAGLYFVFMKWIDFNDFFIYHLFVYSLALFVLLLKYRTELFQKFDIPDKKELKEITFFGFNTLFDNIASLVVNKADVFMIALFLTLDKVAVYNLAFFMTLVINIPNRAIMIIAGPVIAKSVHDKDYKNVRDIYQKSSLTMLLLGGIIFILIWLNFDQLIIAADLPKQYNDAKYVFLFLAISKLVDLIGSVNGSILLATSFFRFNLYFNLILLFITILLNILFIPAMGILGAAIATAISLVLFNLMKGVFLQRKLDMQPFHSNTWKGFIVLSLAFLAGYFFPTLDNSWLDMFIRSTVIALTFFPLLILWNVSEDINQMFYKLVRRFLK
jgi:O-antigen/teichoic acid export membrane protein